MNQEALTQIRIQMEKKKLNSLIVTNPSNLFYIFEQEVQGIFIISQENLKLITSNFYTYFDFDPKEIYTSKDEAIHLLKNLKLKGKIESDSEINQILKKIFPKVKVTELIENVRTIKTTKELFKIKKACKITEKILEKARNALNDKLTEWELYSLIQMEILKKKCLPSFDPLVQVNSCQPHRLSNSKKITKKDLVILDMGVRYQNYCSDMTRTFCLDPNKKQEKLYNDVLDLNTIATSQVKENASYEKISQNIEKLVKTKGYDLRKNYLHLLGHGVGTEVHEKISQNKKLEKGNVFTIEPGLYVPKIGGVRLEDDLIINKKGRKEVLTNFPKELN